MYVSTAYQTRQQHIQCATTLTHNDLEKLGDFPHSETPNSSSSATKLSLFGDRDKTRLIQLSN